MARRDEERIGDMTIRRSLGRFGLSAACIGACLLAAPAWGTNDALQAFLFQACANPTGALATRCGETPGGSGDVSGDSESSLNPSQTLSGADATLDVAEQRGRELRERLHPSAGDAASGERVALGPVNFLFNIRQGETERDRRVDLDPERSYEIEETSAEVGLDFTLNDSLTLGGWVQWQQSELEFEGEAPGVNFTPFAEAGTVDTDALGVTVYASLQLGERGYLDASLGYQEQELDLARNSVFQESTRTVAQTPVLTRADTDGETFSATLNAGFSQELGSWTLTPYAGLTWIDSETDGYTEQDASGSGLALNVSDSEQSALIGQLGFSLNRAISLEGWVLVPQLRAEYVAELDRDRAESIVSLVNDNAGTPLALRGDEFEEDRVDLAVGLVGVFPNGWIPFVEYQLSTGADDLERYRIAAGVRVAL